MAADDVVRRYFAYLKDPSVLLDTDAIADLRKRAESADDVVDRLKLLSEAERMERPDPDALEKEFISVLPRFMRQHDITESALRAQGVPAHVLASAGGRGRRRAASRTATTTRGPGVGVDVVKAAVPASGTFTTKDLRDASNASPGTVRKAMAELLGSGVIVERGPDPDWEGPGRVPTLYEKA